MDIEKLLAQPESKTLEFKRDLSSSKPILKTIIAFANTSGGVLIIGKEPDGKVCGVSNIFEAEEKISSLIADSIRPGILPEIDIVTVEGKDLLMIRVSRWKGPFYLKKEGPKEGVYIRIGSTSRRAEAGLLAEMERDLNQIVFDEQPITEVGVEGIDQNAMKVSFKQKLTKENLRSLKIVVPYQNTEVASVGGIILFGKENIRQNFFPNVKMSCARFQDETKTQFIDRCEVVGSILKLLEEVPRFIRRNTRLASIIEGMKRKDIQEYPETAIREVLVNALVHADYSIKEKHFQLAIYSNRLEIINPGEFPLGFTMDDFKSGVSHIRNRTIVRVFKALEHVEEWGSGYRRIVETCEKWGYPIPQWREVGNTMIVTFYPHPATSVAQPLTPPLQGIEEKILQALGNNRKWKISELYPQLENEVSERSLRYELTKLKEKGLVNTIGKGPATRWYRVDHLADH
ncbi:MAG: putative DNA binding domain-containing protein [Chlamydiia bacterium]|nr:putative DNA binding domain-containing protein [Chlamydiia bacterium]